MEENNDQKEYIVKEKPLRELTRIIVLFLICLIIIYVCILGFKITNIGLILLSILYIVALFAVEAFVFMKYYDFDKNNKIIVKNGNIFYQHNNNLVELNSETVLKIELYAANAIIYNTSYMNSVDGYYYFKIFMKDESILIITSLIASTELINNIGIKPIGKLEFIAFLPSKTLPILSIC